mgnify:FL=1
MNFSILDPDMLEFKDDSELPDIGTGIITLYPEFKNPYKYCSEQTMN